MDAHPIEGKLDDYVWMPSDLKLALGLDNMPVIPYEHTLKDETFEELFKCKDIGLTCINKQTKDKSFLICLTTEDKIYVIDTVFEEHLQFLEKMLKSGPSHDLRFYIYKGHEAAEKLKKRYAIDIGGTTTDLSTLDIFLSVRQLVTTGIIRSYSLLSLYERGIRYRDQVGLALEYLNVELPDLTREMRPALSVSPYNQTAKNAIRIKASTTRIIALRILDRIDRLTFLDSDNIYSFGLRATDDDLDASEHLDGRSYQKILGRLQTIPFDSRNDGSLHQPTD